MSTLATTILIIVILLIILIASIWYAKEGLEPEPFRNDLQIPTIKGSYNEIEFSILDKINTERLYHKLGKLDLEDISSLTIGMHMNTCMRNEKVSHNNVQYRFNDLKELLSVRRLGEIVVYGHKDTESLLEKLLGSSTHRDILLGDYNKIGISAKLDSRSKMYVGLILMK